MPGDDVARHRHRSSSMESPRLPLVWHPVGIVEGSHRHGCIRSVRSTEWDTPANEAATRGPWLLAPTPNHTRISHTHTHGTTPGHPVCTSAERYLAPSANPMRLWASIWNLLLPEGTGTDTGERDYSPSLPRDESALISFSHNDRLFAVRSANRASGGAEPSMREQSASRIEKR